MAAPDRSGQGIELSHREQSEWRQDPGMQVYSPPALEPVVLADNDHKTPGSPWEKSAFPGATHHHNQPYHSGYSTPLSALAAPAYEPPQHQHSYDQHPLMTQPGAAGGASNGAGGSGGKIMGLKRRTFFIVLAIVAFVLVLGIATGVGVGVAVNGKGDSKEAASTPSTTTTATTPTPTRVLPLPVATATTSPTDLIQCPAANLTLYDSRAAPGRRFLLLCGRDYHSADGTRDLTSRPAETMAECIDMCATTNDCVGAGWGFYGGRYVCWLKSKLGTPHEASAWCFAALDG